jgi:colanic acid/amylovoran biosynthesis glycosyltransferase
MAMTPIPTAGPVALQRCSQFVGRTTNWLYDHLRFVPRYTLAMLCDMLLNRQEFPALEARCFKRQNITRRVWHRVAGDRLYPSDSHWLKSLAPSLLHSHFGYVAVDDLRLQRILDVPWLVSFYGADLYQLGRRAEWQDRYAQVFARASLVLALGPVMAAQLERLGCPSEKIILHPLGVDVDNLPDVPRFLRPGEPLKCLFAGTFREKKGIQYVIEAAALAHQAGVPLELHLVGDEMGKLGDRETKEGVLRQIRSFGLENMVIHHPFLSFQELMALALRLHVFMAPSVTATDGDAEGTPFVLQQMLATGMPAIATVHSDIPYLYGEHKHLLVAERDARAIAHHLQRYMEAPDSLVSDGIALRDQIRRAFNVYGCATRLSDLYDLAAPLQATGNREELSVAS